MALPATHPVYGYIRASTDRQIASPETQRQIIEDYAKRLGRSIDHFFIDAAVSGKKSLFERPEGAELSLILNPGDHVIAARLDRLGRSFIGFAHILELFLKKKITMHLCDMPGGVFDPDNPMSELMIGVLIVFANYERRLISVRTREGLQARKQRGERYCRWAEYGWRWEKRFDPALDEHVNIKAPDEKEREILRKAVELRASGQSFDQIRQYLSYQMKARTRMGGEWTTSRIKCLVQQGLRLIAEADASTYEQALASADEDEEYADLIDLDDESDRARRDQATE
jgi:DNA invertase Pin-like site-specific DNA recombinase